jgi:sec-independent protein translocase protein TatB
MKFLNIGIPELIFILVIALIVLGPNGIVKTARTLGKTIRKIIRSPIWAMMLDTQRELREMPTKLVREAGLEEDLAELRKTSREVQQATRSLNQSNEILPPSRVMPNLNLPIEGRTQPPDIESEAAVPSNSEIEGDSVKSDEVSQDSNLSEKSSTQENS